MLQGKSCAWFGIYEKKDAPTRGSVKYTKADRDAMLDKWADLDMVEGWKLRDVRERQNEEGGLIDLEEGLIQEPWYHKRLVLVGDAVRKMEPHAGLGYNCGVSDVTALANGLWRLLQSRDGEAPTTAALEKVFAAYTAQRAEDTALAADMSEKYIRFLAWPTPTHRFVAKYLMPYLPLTKWNYDFKLAPFIERAPLLEALGAPTKHSPVSPRGHTWEAQMIAKGSRAGGILLSTLVVLSLGVYLGRIDALPSWLLAQSLS